MIGFRLALAILGTAVLALPGTARADQRGSVEWSEEWPRFRWWEGAIAVSTLVGAYALENKLHPPSEANWSGPILLDAPMRGLVRGRTVHVEKTAAKYSDTLYQTSALFPFVVDAGIVALGVHRNPDVAAQIALIDAEAIGMTGFVSLFTERLVGRERPYVRDCVNGTALNNPCGIEGDRISFFSGHTSAAFTSAGLTCVHHQHLPLWGGGAADLWACIWALGVAGGAGTFRMIADKHYASDVAFGALVGLTSGYVMPSLLHYGWGGKPSKPAPIAATGVVRPMFFPIPNGAAAGAAGIF